jgi:hypothetical protein
MKNKTIALVSVCLLLVLFVGCVKTLDGRMRAGVPFTRDKIVSTYERPLDQIFSAAKEVLQVNGVLTGENTISKVLEAKIDTRTVWVMVEEAEPKVTRVTVEARRKGGGADIDLASEMDKQIALRLK